MIEDQGSGDADCADAGADACDCISRWEERGSWTVSGSEIIVTNLERDDSGLVPEGLLWPFCVSADQLWLNTGFPDGWRFAAQ